MLKRILLCKFGGYGDLKPILKDSSLKFPYIYFEDNIDFSKVIQLETSFEEFDFSYLENNPQKFIGKYYLLKSNVYGDTILHYDTGVRWYKLNRLREVNTNRPWMINDYDGKLGIKYLDEYNLIDKELNYYEER